MKLSALHQARLHSQLLSGPRAPDALAVAQRLLAIQAQDPRGARLAVRARSLETRASAIDAALSGERSLVVSWLNRGTLHLVRSEDWPWLHALTTPGLATGNARRLAQEGVSAADAERGVGVIRRCLEKEGARTRAQLREQLDRAGVPTKGQALVHLLLCSCLRDAVIRGPMVGDDQAFVLARDWLGETPPVARDVALAELARRYLEGHGPASDRDLARWSGLPLRDARAGLQAIGARLDVRADGRLELSSQGGPTEALPEPRLLGAFDPLLLGWTSREEVLGGNASVVTSNGVFRAIALAEGRAVATWTMPARKVVLAPFAPLARALRAALEIEAGAVVGFLHGQ